MGETEGVKKMLVRVVLAGTLGARHTLILYPPGSSPIGVSPAQHCTALL
jgi:hypothetical protein